MVEAYWDTIAHDTHVLMANEKETKEGVCKEAKGVGCCL